MKPKFGDVLTSKGISKTQVMFIGPSPVREQTAYMSAMLLSGYLVPGALSPHRPGEIQNYLRSGFRA